MNQYSYLENILDKSRIKYDEPMKKHTTIRIGGPAKCLVLPTSIEEIKNIIKYANENNIKYYIIGNGSDIVVRDEGIDGLVIKINSKFDNVDIEGETIKVLAGTSMPKLSQIAKKSSLTGLEFACGIPGTVGGGVRMNAGAYGSEMSNVIEDITYLDENCNIVTITNKEAKFAYRHSIFTDNPRYVVLSATLKLKKGNIEEIDKVMKENTAARKLKQPLEYPNAGSTFKRPEGYFVGKLVSDAGLRGYEIGGAQVSIKHTGFIVNKGNATSKDVEALIKYIQEVLDEKVKLETEIEFIGGK